MVIVRDCDPVRDAVRDPDAVLVGVRVIAAVAVAVKDAVTVGVFAGVPLMVLLRVCVALRVPV
jgi:hypothetical protein